MLAKKKETPVPDGDIVTLSPQNTAVNTLALPTLNPEVYATEVFKPFNTLFESAKADADRIVFSEADLLAIPEAERAKATLIDITTTAGMAVAVKHRAIFRDDIRIDSEAVREERKAPILLIGRLLDSKRKELVAVAKPYEDKFDAVIQAEIARKAAVKAEAERKAAERLAVVRAAVEAIRTLPSQMIGKDAATIRAVLTSMAERELVKEDFDGLFDEAVLALEVAGQELLRMFQTASESEKAEADRIAAAAEAARKVAEQAAANVREAERLAALKREADLAEAERQRQATIAAAAVQAEADRVAAERAKLDADMAAFKAQQEAAKPIEVEAVQGSLIAEEAQPEPVAPAIIEVAPDRGMFIFRAEPEAANETSELPALAAVPDAYAELCVDLCKAVRALMDAGMVADGVLALVEAELLA